MRKKVLTLALALVAVACSSCGNPNGLYPVTGKVLYGGEPAVGATVTFVRKDSANRLGESNPQGVVAEDGTFTLYGPAGSGAAAGEYVVLVEWKEGAGKAPGRAPAMNAPDRLEKKFLDPAKPLLAATVEAKSNVLPPFELK